MFRSWTKFTDLLTFYFCLNFRTIRSGNTDTIWSHIDPEVWAHDQINMMKSYKCPGWSLADLGCCKHFDYSCRDFWANPISLNQSDTVALCEIISILFSTEKKKRLMVYSYTCVLLALPPERRKLAPILTTAGSILCDQHLYKAKPAAATSGRVFF